ncbi:MAG: glycosyltransferase [Actinobacteria bacterium]|nr:glycosyltransferase [Actinomycetota bacterium]
MRILQVVHNFTGVDRGGTELYTQELATALAGEHEVRVLTARVEDGAAFDLRRADRDGLTVIEIVRPRAATFRERRDHQARMAELFGRHVAAERPDVVHFQHAIDLSVGMFGAAQKAGVPSVVSLHDYWYLCPRIQLVRKDNTLCDTGPRGGLACIRHCSPVEELPGTPEQNARARRPGPKDTLFTYRYARMRRALSQVTAFVAPSDHVRSWYAGHGLDRERIRLLPWGMPPAERPRRPLVYPPLRVAFLGRVSLLKGADIAIEAFRAVPPEAARLSLHGPVPDQEAALFADLLRDAPSVRWEGPYEPERLDAVLGAADLLVVPSRQPETFCRVIREAFQRGVPVLARPIGAIPEAVREGVDAVLFQDSRELARIVLGLAADPSEVDRLREGVPEVPTLAEHAARVGALYAELVPS